ncbi:MAG: bifunctional oligoribonuclease/PAP phosphatase NrnA [Burkholderiales bacterium]|nr:bifunctional oligoribonuclease/PAP phosphatase NrnA [Bacteroidia bacterium]
MQKDSFPKFRALLKKSENIVIVTHYNPDGDAMGSSLALYNYLIKTGKNVTVITPNEYPEFLHWLPGHKKVMAFSKNQKKAAILISKSDLIFTLDFNNYSRLEGLGELLANSDAKKILIDHHQQPDNYAALMFHDVKACSTCELVHEFIVGLGGKKLIDKDIAACLYTGIMTDTGSFRYDSVTPNTHLILSDLLATGLKPSDIHSAVYDTYNESRMKLLGYCLSEKMVVLHDIHTAYISLSEKELQKFSHQKGDSEGIVNYPFAIKGIRFCAFFAESEGKIKISFRSKGSFDVNQFARKYFNGGGHINAAGGRGNVNDLQKTVDEFLSLLPLYKKEILKK